MTERKHCVSEGTLWVWEDGVYFAEIKVTKPS